MTNVLGGIYQISSPTGCYIGSTCNFRQRMSSHFLELKKGRHSNDILQKAYKKYNGDLVFSILEYCPKDKLIEREQYYFDNLNPRYNICKVAGSVKGYKHTPEQIKKSHNGRVYDKTKMSLIILNKYTKEERVMQSKKARACWTEKSKEMQIKSLTGRKLSKEHVAKIVKRLTGRKLSQETKDKIAMQKGWKHTQEAKEKMSKALKGKTGKYCKNSKLILCSNGMTFHGSYDAQNWLRENGFPKAHAGRITSVCRGERNKTYGLKWEYL